MPAPGRSGWPVLRRALAAALCGLSVCALPASPAGVPAAEVSGATTAWAIDEAVTTLALDAAILAKLGIAVDTVEPSPRPHAAHPLSVVARRAPSFDAEGPIALRATVAADGFHGFEGGVLRHLGGVRLRSRTGTIDLSRLALRPGKKATTLELVDGAGVAWLSTTDAQWVFDAERGVLRFLNADVRIQAALARRLGDARYAGVTVGVLALDATLRRGTLPPARRAASGPPPPPCGDWSGDIDVALTAITNVSPGGAGVVDGRSVVVVVPSVDLQNVGTANVPWYSKFTNLAQAPFDQHPYLVWQMLRSASGVLEPLGRSDLKHAFLTSNSGCAPGACTNPNILGLGCSDLYPTSSNTYNGALAPRGEVAASTGIWSHCGGIPSHFDSDGDCVQDFFGGGENAFTHGLEAAASDLQVAGASYFVEAFYIVRGDIDIFNSMGFVPVNPALVGGVWTFAGAGAYTQGPAIDAWVNPTTPGPDADNRTIDTGNGHVQLAVRVSDVAGSPGRKRFAYALQNHDFDRRIKRFHVAFNTGVGAIENLGYADGDGDSTNDWTATVDASGITWTLPDAAVVPPTPPAELDYASLVSFRFDSDQSAAPAEATLAPADAVPGAAGGELVIQTLAPATGASPDAAFYTLTPCRLLDTRDPAGGSAPLASGSVRILDVFGVGACGVPANAIAVALNVTAVGSTQGGELAVYSASPPADVAVVAFGAGQTRANNAIALLSRDGKLRIKPTLAAAGSTHAVLDVVGYFVANP